jgi:hypothetical protein
MNRLNIFSATTAIAATRISSGLHPIAMITGLRAEDEEFVITALTPSAADFNLQRMPQMHSRPARPRRLIWFILQPALSVGGISPTVEATPKPATPGDGNHAGYRPATTPFAAEVLPPTAAVVTSPLMEPAAPETLAANSAFAPKPAAPPANAPPPKPPSAISRVELTIDSLRTYDLSRPIPVVVESLGERNYVAEMPDLNLSVSASNPSEIIITLKDRIAQVYDGLRILKHPDAEQARQLRILETYIVKTRRGWLDRR